MRESILLCIVFVCAVAWSEASMAQAATGGTRDTAVPPMVVPIRPRDEPVGTTATPNIYKTYPPGYRSPNIRLRRIHPVRPGSK